MVSVYKSTGMHSDLEAEEETSTPGTPMNFFYRDVRYLFWAK
jgi:hypothetical protein